MFFLWIIKLYWIWIILGLILLTANILSASIVGAVVGGILLVVGLVFRRTMQSESFRNRIERNL